MPGEERIIKMYPDGPELRMQPDDKRNITLTNPEAVTAEVWVSDEIFQCSNSSRSTQR
jgi:hypothetical protein